MRKSNSRLKNTIYNFTTGLVGELIIYILSFVTRTVFIQTLGKTYLGIGGLFTNILSLLSLTDMGVGMALNYRLYDPLKKGDNERIKSIMLFYKTVYRWVGWAILIIGVALVPFLKYLINDYETFAEIGLNASVVFMLYLSQSVSTYWFFAYRSAIVKADQKEYRLNIIGYLFSLLTTVTQIAVLLFTRNYMIYIGVVIVINILQNFVYAKLSDRMYPYLQQKNVEAISKEEKKEIFKDCGAITLFSLNSVVLKATDNLVLSAFIGLDIVGLYSNYLMIYNALKKIIKKIIRSVQASLGNLFASADDVVKLDFFSLMNFIMALICGTASVCVAVLSDEFIDTWLGKEYLIAMPFSILMALELYTIGLKLILEQGRDTLGIFQKLKWRPVASVIINLAVSICMVNVCGIYGVLIGTIISEWFTTLLLDPRMLYKYGFNSCKKVSHYYILNGKYLLELIIIAIINFWLSKNVFVGYGWLSWIIHAIICSFSSFGGLLIINWKTKECQTLMKKVKSLSTFIK